MDEAEKCAPLICLNPFEGSELMEWATRRYFGDCHELGFGWMQYSNLESSGNNKETKSTNQLALGATASHSTAGTGLVISVTLFEQRTCNA